jgi:hypothetical protein
MLPAPRAARVIPRAAALLLLAILLRPVVRFFDDAGAVEEGEEGIPPQWQSMRQGRSER